MFPAFSLMRVMGLSLLCRDLAEMFEHGTNLLPRENIFLFGI